MIIQNLTLSKRTCYEPLASTHPDRQGIAARQFPAVKNGRKSMIPRSFVERLVAEAEAGQTVVVEEAVEQWRERTRDRGSR